MKKLTFASTVTAAMLAFAPAAMAEAPASSIAVVNIQQIMRDSTAAQSIREQLEGKQKSYQAELSKKEEALQKEDKDIGSKKSVLSKEAFDDKVNKFRAKVTDVQKEVQSKKAMLDGASAHAWEAIQQAVVGIAGDIAKEKGFSAIIASATPTSEVLYADSKIDVTADVLSRLNQKLPKVEVKFDAAPSAAPDKK